MRISEMQWRDGEGLADLGAFGIDLCEVLAFDICLFLEDPDGTESTRAHTALKAHLLEVLLEEINLCLQKFEGEIKKARLEVQ